MSYISGARSERVNLLINVFFYLITLLSYFYYYWRWIHRMKDLAIAFSSLWLIYHAVSGFSINPLPIFISDLFQGTYQTNDDLDPLKTIQSQGYPAEAHVVTTQDGYILTMHRIPGKTGSPAIFLQHGLLGSSADWFIVNKTESLAFLLADHGYDVWLGNFRGNPYSKVHVNLSTEDNRFWDFSWHESGIYDLPAMLTYVAEMKQSLLRAYIGFSMGTTAFFVLSSERPEITRLVQSAYFLAPIAYMNHEESAVMRFLAFISEPLKELIDVFGHGEFLPNNILYKTFAKYFCYSDVLEEKVCANTIFLLVGFDNTEFDYELMPTFLNHYPAGGSTKQAVHYGQSINSGYFRQYDYGSEKNLQIYNSTEPPEYNISRITTPIVIFWGPNDWLSDRMDVARFVNELPDKPIFYKVPSEKFNHFDFQVARHVRSLVYDRIIRHGGCLRLDLTAVSSHRHDVYEHLKFNLCQDDAVNSKTAAIVIADRIRNS